MKRKRQKRHVALAIPADETWLFQCPAALAAVQRGLKESALGQVRYLGSYKKFAKIKP